jgi:hypothetical protein
MRLQELEAIPKYAELLETTFVNAIDQKSKVETVLKHFVYQDCEILKKYLEAPVTEFKFRKNTAQADTADGLIGTNTEAPDELLILTKSDEVRKLTG